MITTDSRQRTNSRRLPPALQRFAVTPGPQRPSGKFLHSSLPRSLWAAGTHPHKHTHPSLLPLPPPFRPSPCGAHDPKWDTVSQKAKSWGHAGGWGCRGLKGPEERGGERRSSAGSPAAAERTPGWGHGVPRAKDSNRGCPLCPRRCLPALRAPILSGRTTPRTGLPVQPPPSPCGGKRRNGAAMKKGAERRARGSPAPGGDRAAAAARGIQGRGAGGDGGGGPAEGEAGVGSPPGSRPRRSRGRLGLLTFSVSRSFTVGNGVRADILCGRRGRAGVSPAGLGCGPGGERKGVRARGRAGPSGSRRPRGGATSGPGGARGRRTRRKGRGSRFPRRRRRGTRAGARAGSGRGRLPGAGRAARRAGCGAEGRGGGRRRGRGAGGGGGDRAPLGCPGHG